MGALRFSRGFLFIARVFVEFLRMYVELSAALKIFENFLFIMKWKHEQGYGE